MLDSLAFLPECLSWICGIAFSTSCFCSSQVGMLTVGVSLEENQARSKQSRLFSCLSDSCKSWQTNRRKNDYIAPIIFMYSKCLKIQVITLTSLTNKKYHIIIKIKFLNYKWRCFVCLSITKIMHNYRYQYVFIM